MAMRQGDIEILASLKRTDTPYSSQEDIYLTVAFKNLAETNGVIPYLLEHPAIYILKDKKTGTEKKIDYIAPASPGTGAPEPHPEAIAEPAETVTYRLLIQFPFGFIPAGEYSLQYKVDFPNLSFTTEWLDFTVLPQSIEGYSLTPSSSGKSEAFYLVWNDLATKPARIVFQRSFIGEQKPLLGSTFSIAATDSPGTPIASTSPADQDADIAWVGWVSKGQLTLTRITPLDTVKIALLPLPDKTPWSLIPNLNYALDPNGKDSLLTGMLVGKDDKSLRLSAFMVGKLSGPIWLPPYRLGPGTLLSAKLIPTGTHSHLVIWARYQESTLFIEALDWDETLGLGKTVLKCWAFSMPIKGFKSLDAIVQAPGVKWGLVLHEEALNGEPSTLKIISHSINAKDFRTGPGAPKTELASAQPGPINVRLKFDLDGLPWILQRDVHGLWAQAPDRQKLIPIENPIASRFEDLFFRNGVVPKVLLLNPETGFEVKGINHD